jgi:hypothetical protein
LTDNLRYRLKGRYSGIKNSPEIFLKIGFEIKRGSCFPDGSPRIGGIQRGPEILEKKYLKIFFWKKFIRMFEPLI